MPARCYHHLVVELRRHPRVPLETAVEFVAKGAGGGRITGTSRDISLGGMFIQTSAPLPFGAELVLYLGIDKGKAPLVLPAVVRWTRSGEGPASGMGVQFGLLGARETHAITELTRSAGGGRSSFERS